VATENGFERGYGRAGQRDGEFDDAPDVDGDAVAERVGGLGVDADRVEAHDGGDAGEGAGAEDEEEGEFLAVGALDRAEGFVWEEEDPKVGYYVEGGGCWMGLD
jgi:hypothetical protein